MTQLIEDNMTAIEELCRRFHVARLEVFGSAAEGTFDPQRSDVDFLVEFLPNQSLGPWLAHYFELQKKFEELLGCSVDLVMSGAMKNPFFIREANRTRTPIYESQDPQMA